MLLGSIRTNAIQAPRLCCYTSSKDNKTDMICVTQGSSISSTGLTWLALGVGAEVFRGRVKVVFGGRVKVGVSWIPRPIHNS